MLPVDQRLLRPRQSVVDHCVCGGEEEVAQELGDKFIVHKLLASFLFALIDFRSTSSCHWANEREQSEGERMDFKIPLPVLSSSLVIVPIGDP